MLDLTQCSRNGDPMYMHFAESLVISDPDFQQEDPNFLSRSERYDAAVRKSAQMILKLREYGISDPEEIYFYKRCIHHFYRQYTLCLGSYHVVHCLCFIVFSPHSVARFIQVFSYSDSLIPFLFPIRRVHVKSTNFCLS